MILRSIRQEEEDYGVIDTKKFRKEAVAMLQAKASLNSTTTKLLHKKKTLVNQSFCDEKEKYIEKHQQKYKRLQIKRLKESLWKIFKKYASYISKEPIGQLTSLSPQQNKPSAQSYEQFSFGVPLTHLYNDSQLYVVELDDVYDILNDIEYTYQNIVLERLNYVRNNHNHHHCIYLNDKVYFSWVEFWRLFSNESEDDIAIQDDSLHTSSQYTSKLNDKSSSQYEILPTQPMYSTNVLDLKPTANTTQIDDYYYQSVNVSEHVIDGIQTANRTAISRKILSAKDATGDSRIKYTLSNEINHTPTAITTDGIIYRNIRQDYIPGINLDKDKALPNYTKVTEKQKINSLLYPNKSYSELWRKKKIIYDGNETTEKRNLARKDVLQTFRQFVNADERYLMRRLKEKKEAEEMEKNKHFHDSIANKNKSEREQHEERKTREAISRKDFVYNMRDALNSAMLMTRRQQEQEIKEYSQLRTTSQASLESTYQIEKHYDLSERLDMHAERKNAALVKAAMQDKTKIVVHTVDPNEYFDGSRESIHSTSTGLSSKRTTPATTQHPKGHSANRKRISATAIIPKSPVIVINSVKPDDFLMELAQLDMNDDIDDDEADFTLAMNEYLQRSQQVERIFEETYSASESKIGLESNLDSPFMDISQVESLELPPIL